MSSNSSDEELACTPDFCHLEAEDVVQNILPNKSRDRYLKAYEDFSKWRAEKGTNSLSERVLLAYFYQLSTTYKPSSLWSFYSMLKATLNTKHGVKINKYANLTAFLKKLSAGYKSKKAKVFSSHDIQTFLRNAPDEKFLATKVALIMGVCGACRSQDLKDLTQEDITMADNEIKVRVIKLKNKKTKVDRSFVVNDNDFVEIVKKYKEKRPMGYASNEFFLGFRNGQCIRQPMGKNKLASVPKEVATYLNLPDPQLYTGHSLRRTSATILADIEDSIENKIKIFNKITESINIVESKPGSSRLQKATRHEDCMAPSQNSVQTVHMPGQPVSLYFNSCSNITVNFNW